MLKKEEISETFNGNKNCVDFSPNCCFCEIKLDILYIKINFCLLIAPVPVHCFSITFNIIVRIRF